MCAIIGGSFPRLKKEHIDLIKDMFLQSQIRGRHATGISYVDEDVITISKPIPSCELVLTISLEKFLEKPFTFVGHCRYSTSDLQYNQPIANKDLSVVHNGVVTQDPFEMWESNFSYNNFSTKNDTELIFKSHLAKEQPLKEFPEASMAVCGLTKIGLFFYRNGKRPLHYGKLENNLIVSSTRDIIKRSDSRYQIFDTVAGIQYSLDAGRLLEETIITCDKDLQYENSKC
jgi:glutamine phosphoribosylpyrophosphate amidotransferase